MTIECKETNYDNVSPASKHQTFMQDAPSSPEITVP